MFAKIEPNIIDIIRIYFFILIILKDYFHFLIEMKFGGWWKAVSLTAKSNILFCQISAIRWEILDRNLVKAFE